MFSTPQNVRSPQPLQRTTTPRQSTVSLGSTSASQLQAEGLENAGRLVDHHLKEDASFVELSGQLRIATHGILHAHKRENSHQNLVNGGLQTYHVLKVRFI